MKKTVLTGAIEPPHGASGFANRFQRVANSALFRRTLDISRRAGLSGGRGRRFKSSHSDQHSQTLTPSKNSARRGNCTAIRARATYPNAGQEAAIRAFWGITEAQARRA